MLPLVQQEEAVARPFASVCKMGGRPMPGFIRVEPDGIESDEDLKSWIDMARSYVSALPPKAAKPKKTKTGKTAK